MPHFQNYGVASCSLFKSRSHLVVSVMRAQSSAELLSSQSLSKSFQLMYFSSHDVSECSLQKGRYLLPYLDIGFDMRIVRAELR